LKLFRKKT